MDLSTRSDERTSAICRDHRGLTWARVRQTRWMAHWYRSNAHEDVFGTDVVGKVAARAL